MTPEPGGLKQQPAASQSCCEASGCPALMIQAVHSSDKSCLAGSQGAAREDILLYTFAGEVGVLNCQPRAPQGALCMFGRHSWHVATDSSAVKTTRVVCTPPRMVPSGTLRSLRCSSVWHERLTREGLQRDLLLSCMGRCLTQPGVHSLCVVGSPVAGTLCLDSQ